jgi:hypothetical protein
MLGALALVGSGTAVDLHAQRGGGGGVGQGRPANPGPANPGGGARSGGGNPHARGGGNNAGGNPNAGGGRGNAGGNPNAGGGRGNAGGNPNKGGGNARGGKPDGTGQAATPGRGNPDTNPGSGRGGRGNTGDFDGFRNYGQMVAARHVSENLGVDYDALKGLMTGDNPRSLGQAIQQLRPGVDADAEAAKGEAQAAAETK